MIFFQNQGLPLLLPCSEGKSKLNSNRHLYQMNETTTCGLKNETRVL
jgi:hypothetical protein